MPKATRFDNFQLGMNNVAQPDRLPEGAVRRLVNLDAAEGGTLESRPGYQRVAPMTAARAAGAVGSKVLLIDGDGVRAYDVKTDSVTPVSGSVGAGRIAVARLNAAIYLCTPVESWRWDGGVSLKPWGVHEPAVTITLGPGNLTGVVKVAVTALGEDGEESGCEPYIYNLHNQSLSITTTDSRPVQVYASPPNHEALYLQTRLGGSGVTINQVRDDTARLVTAGLQPFPPCERLTQHHAMIVGSTGQLVVFSEPMMPHLTDPVRRFFQYPEPVTMIASTEGGVFVGTEHETYFISGIESDPRQTKVLGIGAVSDSAVDLPDGRAAWFTRHGQAIGSSDGTVNLVNAGSLAPDIASQGAAGLVEQNGNRTIVTTLRGDVRTNGLGIGFDHDLETD